MGDSCAICKDYNNCRHEEFAKRELGECDWFSSCAVQENCPVCNGRGVVVHHNDGGCGSERIPCYLCERVARDDCPTCPQPTEGERPRNRTEPGFQWADRFVARCVAFYKPICERCNQTGSNVHLALDPQYPDSLHCPECGLVLEVRGV